MRDMIGEEVRPSIRCGVTEADRDRALRLKAAADTPKFYAVLLACEDPAFAAFEILDFHGKREKFLIGDDASAVLRGMSKSYICKGDLRETLLVPGAEEPQRLGALLTMYERRHPAFHVRTLAKELKDKLRKEVQIARQKRDEADLQKRARQDKALGDAYREALAPPAKTGALACAKCDDPVAHTAKFCAECGEKIDRGLDEQRAKRRTDEVAAQAAAARAAPPPGFRAVDPAVDFAGAAPAGVEETEEARKQRELQEVIDVGRDDDDFFGELTPPDK